MQAPVQNRLNRVLVLVEVRLGEVSWLAGCQVTAADPMSVFSMTTMRLFLPGDLAPYPNIRGYLQRIGERPSHRRVMARSDPDLMPILS